LFVFASEVHFLKATNDQFLFFDPICQYMNFGYCCGTEALTQGVMLAKEALYHLRHIPSIFCF
jgi:hypothetical protein